MRRLALLAVLVVGCGHKESTSSTGGNVEMQARIQAMVSAEAALQRTVDTGPSSAFLTAAVGLHHASEDLQSAMEKQRDNQPGEPDVAWLAGVLQELADGHQTDVPRPVRMFVGAEIHDRMSTFHLQPLPYQVDPKTAKQIEEDRAAREKPLGTADDGLKTVRAEVDQLCGCADRACLVPAIRA